MKINHWGI